MVVESITDFAFVKAHIRHVIMAFAVWTFSKVWISASVQSIRANVQKTVIFTIRADNEISATVIRFSFVEVMHLCALRHVFSQGAFGYECVLIDVPVPIRLRMSFANYPDVFLSLA